ncbi:exonuclease domain-containing protein [Paracoccus sp. DMF-8]|nr:exonuclease domain-containing protein [Paracoccus sp. DMF-8]MDF3608282.1 exonuclease domain-containing protein [Paracoccus sp. DMF-8]
MALFDWLFGRTPKPSQQTQPERAKEEFRPTPIIRAHQRSTFTHAPRVPEGSFRFVALDVETACSDVASICQIGLACVQPDNQIQTFSMLVNPGTRFDVFNIQLHGIGPDHCGGCPRFPDAAGCSAPFAVTPPTHPA